MMGSGSSLSFAAHDTHDGQHQTGKVQNAANGTEYPAAAGNVTGQNFNDIQHQCLIEMPAYQSILWGITTRFLI